MSIVDTFTFSSRFVEAGSGLPFGLAVVSGADFALAKEAMVDAKRRAMGRIQTQESTILNRIALFESFFRRHGSKCPLPHQFAKVQEDGALPTISPYVDALLAAELTHGLLMGVQDGDPLAGGLTYDLAENGEQFVGMRGTITCRNNEMVLRDGQGIVASYFQGPDKRSAVKNSTRNLVFYAFAAPGIDAGALNEALADACSMFVDVAEGVEYRVYTA